MMTPNESPDSSPPLGGNTSTETTPDTTFADEIADPSDSTTKPSELRPETPPQECLQPITYSSPSSRMPPFPEESEKVCKQLWLQYHKYISLMRTGQLKKEGPHFLGQGNESEANKFADAQDRRYPVFCLPIGNCMMAVYLFGDPSFVHEGLSTHLHERIRSFIHEKADDISLSQAVKMSQHLQKYVTLVPSPRTLLNVREPGVIKNRKFTAGRGMKEPDAMWVAGPEVPKTKARPFCALEVAFTNEGIDGLIFETKLWTQVGREGRAVQKPLNFVGIYISDDPKDIAGTTKNCFIIIVASAANEEGAGSIQVTAMNASTSLQQLCRKFFTEHDLEYELCNSLTVQLQYSHFCPPLLSKQQWVGQSFAVNVSELEEVVERMRLIEDERSRGQMEEDGEITIPSSDE